jgi:hypothetical protein
MDEGSRVVKGIGDEPEERLVRGPVGGHRRDPNLQDPVLDAIDPIHAAAGREPDRDADRAPGCRRHHARSPNRARPIRTSVAPSSTATSKSSVIPIDSSGPSRES